MNPFHTDRPDDPAAEDAARELFAPLAGAAASPEVTAIARERLLVATSAPSVARGLPLRHRLAFAVGAIVAPLLAVSAVGALTGNDALNAPVEAVSNAAKMVGIGGQSGDHRQDADHRNDKAGDSGQPGSCPGNSCDAPGHNKQGSANSPSTSAASATGASSSQTKPSPHENGHGCDDKLFADGAKPPFAGHDAPVGRCNNAGNGGSSAPGNATPGAKHTPHPGNGDGNGHRAEPTQTPSASPAGPGNSGGHANGNSAETTRIPSASFGERGNSGAHANSESKGHPDKYR